MEILGTYNLALYKDPSFFKRALARCIAVLEPHADKFEVIAFRGTSGAMFAPAIASALGKHFTNVRKSDGHHEAGNFSGAVGMKTYIIVDDLVSTGATLRKIQDMIYSVSPESRCIGYYLWNYDTLTLAGDPKGNLCDLKYIVDYEQKS